MLPHIWDLTVSLSEFTISFLPVKLDPSLRSLSWWMATSSILMPLWKIRCYWELSVIPWFIMYHTVLSPSLALSHIVHIVLLVLRLPVIPLTIMSFLYNCSSLQCCLIHLGNCSHSCRMDYNSLLSLSGSRFSRGQVWSPEQAFRCSFPGPVYFFRLAHISPLPPHRLPTHCSLCSLS